MIALDNLLLAVVLAAVFFYVLFGLIRAAVRDGILQANERRKQLNDEALVDPDL